MIATPRHPFEELLAQLTGAMRLRHGFGTKDDAQHTDATRIIWIPGAIGIEPCPYRLPDQDNPWRQVAEFEVSIYGGSPAEVYGLHNNIVGWIDYLIGPPKGCAPSDDGSTPHRPGYRFSTGKAGPRGGDGVSAGWGAIAQVTLFDPVVRRVFPLGAIISVTSEVDAVSSPATSVIRAPDVIAVTQ